jgi:hypothetical protein
VIPVFHTDRQENSSLDCVEERRLDHTPEIWHSGTGFASREGVGIVPSDPMRMQSNRAIAIAVDEIPKCFARFVE